MPLNLNASWFYQINMTNNGPAMMAYVHMMSSNSKYKPEIRRDQAEAK